MVSIEFLSDAAEGTLSGPFPSERSRRHLLVDLAMVLGARKAIATPHLHGGDDDAKLRYEWEAADELWTAVAPHASIEDLEDRDVLDAGCGWGGKAIRYAMEGRVRSMTGFDLAGLYDPAVPMRVARAAGLTQCRFVEGRAEEMPFPASSFDVCILDDVIEHLDDPGAALGECVRVLRSGGLLIAKFPSIRMVRAHHLDRALSVPGLHYPISLKTWAEGLNDWRERHPDRASYQPFDESVRSRFGGRWVTRNLNGLDLAAFRALVAGTPLTVRHLGVRTVLPTRFGLGSRVGQQTFRALAERSRLREVLGTSVVFVGIAGSG